MVTVRLDPALRSHPKFQRAMRLLKVDNATLFGLMVGLFMLPELYPEYAKGADLTRFSPQEIADEVKWEQDAERFIRVLLQVGLLDRTRDGRLLIHDWHDYTGLNELRRERNAERMRQKRAAEARAENSKSEILKEAESGVADRLDPRTDSSEGPAPSKAGAPSEAQPAEGRGVAAEPLPPPETSGSGTSKASRATAADILRGDGYSDTEIGQAAAIASCRPAAPPEAQPVRRAKYLERIIVDDVRARGSQQPAQANGAPRPRRSAEDEEEDKARRRAAAERRRAEDDAKQGERARLDSHWQGLTPEEQAAVLEQAAERADPLTRKRWREGSRTKMVSATIYSARDEILRERGGA